MTINCNKKVTRYWENGRKKSVVYLSKDGRHANGKSKYYYRNGKIMRSEFLHMDTLKGEIKEWDSLGVLLYTKKVLEIDKIEMQIEEGLSITYLMPYLEVKKLKNGNKLEHKGFERYGKKQGTWEW
ncbi:MAG: hypothetical protein Q8R57_02025 [Bacteroidota bacterium]|nr:hypothetical protein [Bacteroidota bacterium]